ncbi:calcium/sodium antiporter [Candidatus Uhrbacteria bacterium]|nr:calcium/sodium antiporter [Candidatus Uhrbacteria bacterium]
MEILFWAVIFFLTTALLVRSADWLLASAEKIGLAAGLSPFIVGATIVGIGTSFPELVSSIAAVLSGATEIVAANAIGSNIANILLVVGLVSLLGGRIVVTKSLIDLDLPLLAVSTVLFLAAAWDRIITFPEAIFLLIAYAIYLLYTILHTEEEAVAESGIRALFHKRRKVESLLHEEQTNRPKILPKDIMFLAFGIAGLAFSAKYLIDSVIALSTLLHIATGTLAITAVAIGTSLPELIVSAKAALGRKSEVALGNIFGSNIFNVLAVIGIPGLFQTLALDEPTYAIGLPALAATTILFIISGVSMRFHVWEGAFYLVLYTFFLGKLFQLL